MAVKEQLSWCKEATIAGNGKFKNKFFLDSGILKGS
jgi:hypothetical protein